MMAADLLDRVAKMVREGAPFERVRIVDGVAMSLMMGAGPRDDSEYIRALGFATADRSVRLRDHFESIERGDWPVDSLVGQVRKRLVYVESTPAFRLNDGYRGEARALDGVLDLLGVKP